MIANNAFNVDVRLSSNYSFELRHMNKREWAKCLLGFEDANIYQTWSYSAVRWGKENICHALLKKNNITVSAAQVVVIKTPIFRSGIAYIRWAPLWQRCGHDKDKNVLQQMLGLLFQEFAASRGLLLRIQLPDINNERFNICEIFKMEGFKWICPTEQTLLIDLNPSLDMIQGKMNRSWKRALKKCLKISPVVIQGHSDELFQIFLMLHDELVQRKGHDPGLVVNEYREMQKDLQDALKMQIIICEFDGEPVAAIIGSLINQKGIGLLGATARKGLNNGAYHFLVLKMIEWMKNNGASSFDFGGYDPKLHPGTARFKEGLTREIISYGGRFEAYCNLYSHAIVSSVELYRDLMHKLKFMLFKQV